MIVIVGDGESDYCNYLALPLFDRAPQPRSVGAGAAVAGVEMVGVGDGLSALLLLDEPC